MNRSLQLVILFAICSLPSGLANAQTWSWGKNIANASYTAFGAKMATGPDGSWYLGDRFIDSVSIGTVTYVPVNSDYYITKHDSNGTMLWSKSDKGLPTGDNPSSFQSELVALSHGGSGNLYAFGKYGFSLNNADRVFLAKYNSSGVKQWNAWAKSASVAAAISMCANADGDIFITGHTANTITFYDGDGFSTQANNFLVAGGQGTEFLAKYNASGVFQWVKEYKATTWPTRATSLTAVNDGLVLCGYTDGGGSIDFGNSVSVVTANLKKSAFIVKYDFQGLAQWAVKAEGADRPFITIALDSNSDIVMCGKLNNGGIGSFTTSSAGYAGFAGKVSAGGTVQWVSFDTSSPFAYTQRVGVAASGSNILVVGNWYNNSFMTIQRFTSAGAYLAVDSATNDTRSNVKASGFITTSDGSIYLAGTYCGTINEGSVDLTSACNISKVNMFVAKISPTGGTVISGVRDNSSGEFPTRFSIEQNYPNPFNPSTTIEFSVVQEGFVTLKVYDLLGQDIATLVQERLSPGPYTATWDASASGARLPSGVYFLTLRSGADTHSRKLLLSK